MSSSAPTNSHGPARLAAEQLIVAVGDLSTWSVPAAHTADAAVDRSSDTTIRDFLISYFDQLQEINAKYIATRNTPPVVHEVAKFVTDSGYHTAGCTCGTGSEFFSWESNLDLWITDHTGVDISEVLA